MLSKDGEVLAYVSFRLMNWYLKRGLATQLAEREFQLHFQHSGKGRLGYKIEFNPRPVRCVMCGAGDPLEMHHVVPSCFRRHFALKYKEHSSYDVVATCKPCHVSYERIAEKEKNRLRPSYPSPPEVSRALTRLRIAKTILNQNPPYESLFRLWAKLPCYLALDKFRLPEFIAEQELITKSFSDWTKNTVSNMGEEQLILFWRKHFLEHAKPKFLPDGWEEESGLIHA
jgi:hypothetical protein